MARKLRDSSNARPAYKPGYIVYLRSGGPEMVIESIEANGDLNCVWFALEGEHWKPPCRDRFIADSVQMAVDGDAVDSRRGYFYFEDNEVAGAYHGTKPVVPRAERKRF